MSSSPSRPLLVSADNYSSLISIVAWIFLVTTSFSVIARLSTRFAISRKFKLDDLLIVIALITSIAYAIVLSVAAINGLGRPLSSLERGNLRKVEQLRYASDLLYASTLCCTKISMAVLLWSLSPIAIHRRLSLAIGVLVSIWTVTSVFVLAFQCQIPRPWEVIGSKCIAETAFWAYFETVNIVTDFALILLPLGIVWNLQAKKARKLIVAGCFASRILVVAAAVTRIIYLAKVSDSGDMTLEAWPAALCALTVESLSIIVACIPYLKPFLDSLESGMMNNDKLRREGMSDVYSRSRSKATSKERAQENTSAGTGQYIELGSVPHGNMGMLSGPDMDSPDVRVAPQIHVPSNSPTGEWDSESHTSQTRFIRKTTTLSLTTTPRAKDGIL